MGITIDTFRVKVSGTISYAGDNFFITSRGDGTQFQLIAPLYTELGRYAPRNLASHPFSSAEKSKLLDLSRENRLVEIAGPLYLPANYPNILIVQTLAVSKEATFTNSSKSSTEQGKAGSKRSGLNEELMAKAMGDEKDRSGKAAAGRVPDEFVKVAEKEGG